MKGKSDTLQELQKDGRIFYTIFYYTVLIILGPVLIFFGSKIVVLDGMNNNIHIKLIKTQLMLIFFLQEF